LKCIRKKEDARKRKISENNADDTDDIDDIEDTDDSDDADSDYNIEVMAPKKKTENVDGKDVFEVVAPEADKKPNKRKLTPKDLAFGTLLIQSKKSRDRFDLE